MLLAQDLSCQRGTTLLFEQLNLQLCTGECLHLTGSNGSGKTSLLKILAGLRAPDSGQINWNSESTELSQDNQPFAYLGHKEGIKNELDAEENVRFAARLTSQACDDQVVHTLLHRVGILHRADIYAQNLSFGQRKRLSFACLLAKQKTFWLLDEPFSGVDNEGREQLQELCLQHVHAGGAILLSHHGDIDNVDLRSLTKTISINEFAGSKGQ